MSTGTSCEVERQIHSEIRELELVTNRVVEVIGRAGTSLTPVLSPGPEDASPSPDAPPAAISPVAADIRAQCDRIDSAVNRLAGVLDRLEV